MRNSKSLWWAAVCAAALILALSVSRAADKKEEKEQRKVKQQPKGQAQSPKAAPAQVRQADAPKAVPARAVEAPTTPGREQVRPVETPKTPPPQAAESQTRKAQPEERPRLEKESSEHRAEPKAEKKQSNKVSERPAKPEKGQARQVPDRPVKSQPDNKPVKSQPEKSQAHDERPTKAQPEKNQAQNKEGPAKSKPEKEQQVHARQPSQTLKPEQSALIRPAQPQFKLTEVKKPGGTVERVSPSNKVRERTVVEKKTGNQCTQQLGVTGRVEVEEVKRKDGTKQLTQYDLGREKKIQVVRKDGCVETTDVHYSRNGQPRARETIVCDANGKAVSKTVIVQQNLIVNNTTIVNNNTRVVSNTRVANNLRVGGSVRYANNTTVVRTYYPSRYGFVYRPVVIAPIVFASWYDPYWYSPAGAVVYHPFRYSWGWHTEPWYRCHTYYWTPYTVYSAPCYWITDWLVAGYIADRYAAAASVDQTREEVRLAREEAEKARIAAEQARDAAEIAEAKAAQAAAEARAERAEARAAKAELEEAKAKELAAGKTNPNATPIDKETKDALKDQIEKVIAEKKAYAELSAKGGNPVPPDVTVSLTDPRHIFPVSKTISVIRAEDSNPAGVLTAGDLLRVEPGQEKLLAEATENTPITMRVITSKGDDESVRAGTLVAIPLKELQEFDNEFRAKIDLGLTEANNNKEQFKKEAVN